MKAIPGGAPVGPEQPASDDPLEADTPPAWTYTVSVRSLCEFTAKRGDLDRRFTPSATALEGQAGEAAVASRRGPDYEKQLLLEGLCGHLRVRGRADGHDPARRCLEEIKTIRGRPEDIPENRRHLHWAQLETYGALLCRARGLADVELALVYVDAVSQAETVLRQSSTADELEQAFETRCRRFAAWAAQESAHRASRDAALLALPFPLGALRPGQRTLAEAVYRAAVNARCLLAQAPTGIGKTLGTLFPLLRAMPGQKLDKIGYLTCKGTGRIAALDALHRLREATAGRALRVMTLVAKDQGCEHPDKACHGDSCPLARGFYDRLPAARAEAVEGGWMDQQAQRRVALLHGICPYYLGQELMRWADVVVGDVHHAFDPKGQLFGLMQALDWRVGLLVDEAHNLIDRTRAMYSASLSTAQARTAAESAPAAPAALRSQVGTLVRAIAALMASQGADGAPLDEVPDAIVDALQQLNASLGEHFQTQASASGPLLEFYFASLAMQRAVERFGTHSLLDIERITLGTSGAHGHLPAVSTAARPRDRNLSLLDPIDDPSVLPPADEEHREASTDDVELAIRNVVPGPFLRARFAAFHTVTLFSATLTPDTYQRDMLGLPADAAWIDVPPVFAPENLVVRIADSLSTRFPHREASLDALVDLIAKQFAEAPGNYLAFFSSFAYLDRAAARMTQRHPGVPQWRQSRAMTGAQRHVFLERFVPDGQGVGFAVLGGAMAEGVDLPGTRLIGAFIATLGLPPESKHQQRVRARLDDMFGQDHGYADRVPGMQKVVQAAGRILRSNDDRGWLWLMDRRYRSPEVLELLPAWWFQLRRTSITPCSVARS